MKPVMPVNICAAAEGREQRREGAQCDDVRERATAPAEAPRSSPPPASSCATAHAPAHHKLDAAGGVIVDDRGEGHDRADDLRASERAAGAESGGVWSRRRRKAAAAARYRSARA